MLAAEFEPAELGFLSETRATVGQTMFGMDDVVNLLLIALIARGHVLLEGNPGLGKTALVRTLADAMGLEETAVGRIQFTPDLMPSDITGTRMPDSENFQKLTFEKGPIFRQLLIADEINRATPKTQSAMLEAMAERQVTVLGDKHTLTQQFKIQNGHYEELVMTPFMVMATQNPIDQEGTYALPEAQADRFMFKVRMPFPDRSILNKIVTKEHSAVGRQIEGSSDSQVSTRGWHEALLRLHLSSRALAHTKPADLVQEHILNLVQASNGNMSAVTGIRSGRLSTLDKYVSEHIDYPLGPRAAVALSLGAVGWAAVTLSNALEGSQIVANTQNGLLSVALPVLRHRLKIRQTYDTILDSNLSQEDRLDAEIRKFLELTAPDGDYLDYVRSAYSAAGDTRF